MKLRLFCSQGKLQVNDQETFLRIADPFGQTLWECPTSEIIGFTLQPYLASWHMSIHSQNDGIYRAEAISQRGFKKLHALCPRIPVREEGPEWFCDPSIKVHSETYTSDRAMQREIEDAAQYGWMPQTSAGIGSHINVGRTMTKFVLTGGIGLMTGASRSKDKITVTFIRQSAH